MEKKYYYYYNQRGELEGIFNPEEAFAHQGKVNSEANNPDERISLWQGAEVK